MNECCENLDNRAEGPGPRGGEIPEGTTVTHCTVCECRHFGLPVDPLKLGLKVARI